MRKKGERKIEKERGILKEKEYKDREEKERKELHEKRGSGRETKANREDDLTTKRKYI